MLATQSVGAALALVLATALARAEVIHVKMEKLGFAPADITAHVGDTIDWDNHDFVAHTATARSGAWDVMIPADATKSLTVDKEGTYAFYCKFHPNMTGTLTVTK